MKSIVEYINEQNGTTVDRVIFRKEKDGEVCAFLIDDEQSAGNVTCYSHVGQHSTASLSYMTHETKPCKSQEEYKDLYDELTKIGYNLKVVQKYTPKR